MIGYNRPLLTILPVVAQAFDAIDETDTICGAQIKAPCLEDYDDDGLDGEECEERLSLSRWHDRHAPGGLAR